MKRRVFTVLSAISFTVTLAALLLWGRSYFVSDCIEFVTNLPNPVPAGPRHVGYVLQTAPGVIGGSFQKDNYQQQVGAGFAYQRAAARHASQAAWWPQRTFMWSQVGGPPVNGPWFQTEGYTCPLWIIAGLGAIFPYTRLRKNRRFKIGHCPQCGYDLRATPEAGGRLLERCPECGSVAERRETVKL